VNLSNNALRVLQKRYSRGETPEQTFRRVAEHVALAEKPHQRSEMAEKFYHIMSNMLFLPNSPTIMNAGRELGQLSACFVLPVEDSIDGIFKAQWQMALIQKSGGGTGFSFSRLRPKGATVSTTAGVSSGPVSFMRSFNAATETIKQGGTRRGANMAVLRVDHPDIEEFIRCKAKEGELSNFNISVAITDEFMDAVQHGRDWELSWDGKYRKVVKARDLWNLIVEYAWLNGEPGVIFIDEINRKNPILTQCIESTNPCGEQPLAPYESCNLGSINLGKMVTEEHAVDYEQLKKVTKIAVRFLDNVIDVNKYPLPEIERETKKNRKIGLGVMGFADMLFKLMIPYNSKEALEVATCVMRTIDYAAFDASYELAQERGSFPNIDNSVYKDKLVRNATRTTIAPTGSISMIADASSGIEPVFSLAYKKAALDEEFMVVNSVFGQYIASKYEDKEELILEQVIENGGSCKQVTELSEKEKAVFATALEMDPEWHVLMQARFQQYTNNAVSKTINLPRDATKKQVEDAILLAYKQHCKGITVYREGSREQEALYTARRNKRAMQCAIPIHRPTKLHGFTEKVQTGCGRMYITVNSHEGKPIETFVTTGSSGGCKAFAEGVSRLVSLALRSGVSLEHIANQLRKVSCQNFIKVKVKNKELVGKSCPDVIGRILAKTLGRDSTIDIESVKGKGCPNCGELLKAMEGCFTCINCGYSECN